MTRQPVDLTSHINHTIERGHPADFPVTLRPVFYADEESYQNIPRRLAVIREDTGETLAVVSNRYTLVPHQEILDITERAIGSLDVGPVPRGLYVDRQGARMRALFKFPALARPVLNGDEICPCLKVQNTYDGTSRIAIHIGAFRFVCTNLAVGGGGVFAGGFMAIHAGEIPLSQVTAQLEKYLGGFEEIVAAYRVWRGRPFDCGRLTALLEGLSARATKTIGDGILQSANPSVYDAYNTATWVATHQMRSYRTAFDLLERINRRFQQFFPF